MSFDYFYGPDDTEQYSFYRIPKRLITGDEFQETSTEAKLLYGLMLDRLQLSIRNQWLDALNRVYIIYTVEDIIEEITLHFGKGTVKPFTAKDGREMLKIVIPNADRSDHTPWASFVLPAKAVHENQYGKGLWAKIPADGHTTLTKPYLAGQGEDGKNIWKDEKTTVSNRELKSMVEFYKKDLIPKYDIPEL